jgi:hypothetical protein
MQLLLGLDKQIGMKACPVLQLFALLEEGGVYNTLDVASYTTRAYVCGPVNVANDVLETLSKCNTVLVHAIATFFDLIGNEWELTVEWFPMHCGRPHTGRISHFHDWMI